MGLPATVALDPTLPVVLPLPPRPRLAAETVGLTVVIVNFRQWGNTAALTRQLRQSAGVAGGRAEVVIVDNHSPDADDARRVRRWEGVSLRRFGRNRGFARAVNEGVRLGRGDWVLLLNPDVRVDADFADRALDLIGELERDRPEVGVVGFRLRHGDGSPQASCGTFPTLWNTLAGLLRARKTRKCRHLERDDEAQAVPWVTGCCLLARRACLEQLDGLDESFFLYYEDVDLCRRARAAGWEVRYEPGLEAVHFSPLHARRVPAALHLLTRHALLTYGRKHWPRWQAAVLNRLVRLESAARQARARWSGDAPAAEAFARLRELAGCLSRGDESAARRHTRWAARQLETDAGLGES